MATLPSDFTITSDGSYDYESLLPHSRYVLEFVQEEGETFPTDIQIQFKIGPGDTFVTVENGTFDTDNRGARFVSPSKYIRFVVTGTPDPFRISLTEY